jgi:hypothetical protein
VEQNGQYFCEWDGKTYASATHRYILMARFADESGELPVQIFNDQVGCSSYANAGRVLLA